MGIIFDSLLTTVTMSAGTDSVAVGAVIVESYVLLLAISTLWSRYHRLRLQDRALPVAGPAQGTAYCFIQCTPT